MRVQHEGETASESQATLESVFVVLFCGTFTSLDSTQLFPLSTLSFVL